MSHEEFKPDDIFINRIKAHPELNFFIYDSEVRINNRVNPKGTHASPYDWELATSQPGYLSLFQMNINRSGGSGFVNDQVENGPKGFVFPWFINSGANHMQRFRNTSYFDAIKGKRTENGICFDGPLSAPGQIVSGSYPMSASITRIFSQDSYSYTGYDSAYGCGTTAVATGVNKYTSALQNVAKKYTPLSKHFCFAGTTEVSGTGVQNLERDLTELDVNIINIPSIFYGSSLKKGSVTLKYYITGTLIAECSDSKRNGELVETVGSKVGSVVGVVMYDEGLMLLTASHGLGSLNGIKYGTLGYTYNKWIHFGTGCNDGIVSSVADPIVSASFDIACRGTSYVDSMTLFCHAKKNKLDYSNNPTFIDISGSGRSVYSFSTSSYSYSETPLKLKNVVSSSFSTYSSSYEKTTYLSKIGVYDKEGNLIMIASMAKPVKKTIQDEYTFKLTLDI
jgi:hypothetical protein